MNDAPAWLIAGMHTIARNRAQVPPVNFVLNRFCLKQARE
jgi:hypothetical protein